MEKQENRVERIGILVVHGVGEQTYFEHLESIASNLYKALQKEPQRRAYVQIRRGDQVPRRSPEETWHEVPASVRWRKPDGGWIEAYFREVHWADLDVRMAWRQWLKLVGWSLGVSGVLPFLVSKEVDDLKNLRMCAPDRLKAGQRLKVWFKLFGVSLLFFFLLLSIDLLYASSSRLFNVQWFTQLLKRLRGIIYNYLGDVKLYQDQFERKDDRLETVGEKSRVAIRRRMVRALVDTAADVEAGNLDGYYILAHSLGTVVAFNALMEHELAVPNYLTQEEWMALPVAFRKSADRDASEKQMPRRPPWLGKRDAINRQRLFSGLRGLLTIGSPLDKFAALWPAIVPVNGDPIPGEVSWVNVADVQDIVAGSIDLFPPCVPGDSRPKVGGLSLKNFEWVDQLWPFSAHTAYWKVGKRDDRLIDRIVTWLERGQFDEPGHRCSHGLAMLLFYAWIFLLSVGFWCLAAGFVWLVLGRVLGFALFSWTYSFYLVGLSGALIVFVISLSHRIWEEYEFGEGKILRWVRRKWIYFLIGFVVFGLIAYVFRHFYPTEQGRAVLSIEVKSPTTLSPSRPDKPGLPKEKSP